MTANSVWCQLGTLSRTSGSLMLFAFAWTIICMHMFGLMLDKQQMYRQAQQAYAEVNSTDVMWAYERVDSVPEAPPTAAKPAYKPFIPHKPIQVIILAYQRTGSSYLGKLFGQNNESFYAYEPLDGTFAGLYATNPGWAVPAEISHYWNGSVRPIPVLEQRAMAETLMGLLTCQLSTLPDTVLGNPFWNQFPKEQPGLHDFSRCIKSSALKSCSNEIRESCPGRLGQNTKQSDICHEELVKRGLSKTSDLDWMIESNGQDDKYQSTFATRKLLFDTFESDREHQMPWEQSYVETHIVRKGNLPLPPNIVTPSDQEKAHNVPRHTHTARNGKPPLPPITVTINDQEHFRKPPRQSQAVRRDHTPPLKPVTIDMNRDHHGAPLGELPNVPLQRLQNFAFRGHPDIAKQRQPFSTHRRKTASQRTKNVNSARHASATAIYHAPNTSMFNQTFDKYAKCLGLVKNMGQKCQPLLQKHCTSNRIRAIKTVRLDMASIEVLLEHLPNLRVIHLLRDPRGVALSRSGVQWSAGHDAANDIVKAAAIFCQAAARDIKERQRLEARFPGTFYEVIYEDFTSSPVEKGKEIYEFLNSTMPDKVHAFLNNKTQTVSSGKWQDKLTFHQAMDIHNSCKELFELTQEKRWLTL